MENRYVLPEKLNQTEVIDRDFPSPPLIANIPIVTPLDNGGECLRRGIYKTKIIERAIMKNIFPCMDFDVGLFGGLAD